MWGFVLLFVIFCVLAIFDFYHNKKTRPKDFPPGPPKLPLWGSYWFLLKENYNFTHLALKKLSKQYKTDILGFFLGDEPAVAATSYELCKELLTRDEFIGRDEMIVVRERSLGSPKGVLFTDGDFWKTQRRFSLRQLRDFGFGCRSKDVEDLTTDEVKYLINFLKRDPEKQDFDVCKTKGQVLIPDLLYGPLLNVILSILTSSRFDYPQLRKLGKAGLKFNQAGDATGSALRITPWLRFIAPKFFGYTDVVKQNQVLLDFLKEIINDHLKTFSDEYHRDFIDVFISESYKNGNNLDYRQLLLTLLDYMFPTAVAIGHTLSFYFVYLINNPQVQEKIHEEMDRVVGQSRLPDLNDRENMPYLEASIREGTRIFPAIPLGIPRRCIEDTYLGGYFIPKNTVMIPCVWTAHKDEKVWKNPEKFEPERFLTDEGKLIKKDATLGFGDGKRLCAGQTFARHTIFLFVASLLQNFTLKSCDDKPVKLDIVPGVSLSMRENWVKFVPRD